MTSSVSSSNGESVTSNRRQSNPDPFEERERIEQEGRQRLVQDPNFRLLKVVHGEAEIDFYRNEIKSLTVVTPATDRTIAEDVQKEGWLCLSHMWGDPSEWIVWDDAGVADGDTGELIKPKVHPDKRAQIMTLLQHTNRYYWVDIFCAQSDTPLGIMGAIYKHCRWCTAFIDSVYVAVHYTFLNVFTDAVELSIIHLNQAADGYLDIIKKTHHKDDVSAEWTQVLKDLLHWSSARLEEVANPRLIQWSERYSRSPTGDQFFDSLMQHPVDEIMATAQKFFNSKDYNPSDFTLSEEDLMAYLQAYTRETFIRAQQDIATFLNCRWMNRVWTLQELALPGETTFLSGESDRDSIRLWMMYSAKLLKVIAKAYEIRETTSMDSQSNRERGAVLQTPHQVLNYYQQTDPVLARIYSDYRKMLEVAITCSYNSPYRKQNKENVGRRITLNALATSQRKALYPEDYVYGVLGILDIDIPRLKDRDEIWRIFSEKLRERYPDIHVPSDVNLDKATKMEDVYGGFGFTRGWDLSSEVVDYLCFK